MEIDHVSMFCRWEEWDFNEDADFIIICHHPLREGFCKYCNPLLEVFDHEECVHFEKPLDEPSQATEEVRQYLEYTEPKKE